MDRIYRVLLMVVCFSMVAGQQAEKKDPLVGMMLNKMRQNHQLSPQASSDSEKKIMDASQQASTPAPTPPPSPPKMLKVGRADRSSSPPSQPKQEEVSTRPSGAALGAAKQYVSKPKKQDLAGMMNKIAGDRHTEALQQARRQEAQEQEAAVLARKKIEDQRRAAVLAEQKSQLERQAKLEATRRAAKEIEDRQARAEANRRAEKEINERQALNQARTEQARNEANRRAAKQELEERQRRAEGNRRQTQELEERQRRAETNRRAAQELEERQRRAEATRRAAKDYDDARMKQQLKQTLQAQQENQRRNAILVEQKKLEEVKKRSEASRFGSAKPSAARQRIEREVQQPWGRDALGAKSKYANYALQQGQKETGKRDAQPSYVQQRLREAVQREDEENDHGAMAEAIVDSYDTDGDGQISYYELMDHVSPEHHKSPEFQGLLDADEDGDMFITLEELASRLKHVDQTAKKGQQQKGPNSEHVAVAASIMDNLDANGDGKVSLQELVNNLKDEHHNHPDFKGWHAGFKEADADNDMHLTIKELAHLFKAFDDDQEL